jgi:TetR/AcrR family transcriptional regulator
VKDRAVRVRNPAGTKQAVIESAGRLFSERGFAGTSMRDIADDADVTQALIHHHFGSKDELYTAVRHRVIEEYNARFPEIARVTDHPVNVGCELGRLLGFLRENTPLLRMIGWSRLERDHRMLPGDAELRGAMVRRIETAQALGLVRTDVEAAYLVIMLEALVVYWLENREFNADLLAGKPDDDTYLRQAATVLEQGLAPVPPARGRGKGSLAD